jgi:hypothetical protein
MIWEYIFKDVKNVFYLKLWSVSVIKAVGSSYQTNTNTSKLYVEPSFFIVLWKGIDIYFIAFGYQEKKKKTREVVCQVEC